MAMIDSAKPSVADIAKAARLLALELNLVLDVDANVTIGVRDNAALSCRADEQGVAARRGFTAV